MALVIVIVAADAFVAKLFLHVPVLLATSSSRVAGLYVNDFAISALLSSRLIHNPLYSPV